MALSRDIVLRLLGESSSATKALKDAANAAEVTVKQYRDAEREQAKQTAAMQKASAAQSAAYKQAERDQDKQTAAMQKASAAQSAAHKQMGVAAMAMGAAVGVGLGMAVKAAIDWESAFAGVAKTVEGTPEQMAALEQSLRGLALILPVTHTELAAVAEAAGQLGVTREDLVAFTATAIALGETTNLSATDAATGLAQLSNVMGTSADDTDRLGSALVELGNNGASTEADILAMAQRIAGAGQQIGLTEGEVLGFAAALANVGIEAEAGGSAISRVMIDIASSVEMGGDKLELFAQVAGMSVEQFSTLFETDAAGAIAAFVTGLGQIDAAGGSTFQTLDQLGLSEVRTRDALLRLSAGADGLTTSLAMGNQAWTENSALLEEAAKRYATTEAQLEMARNSLVDAGIDIGNTLIPVLLDLGNVLVGLIGWFQDLPGPVQAVVTALAALSAVGLLGVGGLTAAKGAMQSFASTAEAAGGSVSKFGKAASGALAFVGGPWGIALAAAAFGIGTLAKESAESEGRIRELTAAIDADSGALGLNTKMALVNTLQKEGLLAQAEGLGIELDVMVAALTGDTEAQRILNQAMVEGGGAGVKLGIGLAHVGGELTAAQEAYRLQQAALEGSTGATEGAIPPAEALGSAVGAAAAETATMAEAADALKEALDALTGVFVSAVEAEAEYQAATDALAATIAELGGAGVTTSGQIDLTTEAGRTLQGEFINLRDAGNEVVESLIRQGDTQGALAADQRLRDQFIAQANDAGIFGQEAENLANNILGIPTERHTEITTTANEAAAGVRNLYNEIAGLNNREIFVTTTYTTKYQTDYLSQGVSGGRAYGGPIRGVGGPREDNILTPTSVGEFVQPVDATEYYGVPFMEAIRTKSLPRMGEGMAYGGCIGAGMAGGGSIGEGMAYGGSIGAGMAGGGQVGTSAPVVTVNVDMERLAAVLESRPILVNLVSKLEERVLAEAVHRVDQRNAAR